MAYTGILVRGEVFNTIYLDPPIAREIVMAGEHLGLTTVGANTYWLNVAALSAISGITDDQGNFTPGFKTSDLPITYDAVGYIKSEATHMLVNGSSLWRYAPLGALEVLTNSSFKFGSYDLKPANLDFITTYVPVMSALTTSNCVVTFTKGIKARVFNETTRQELGVLSTSGGTLTFSGAQTLGDIITAQALDADYNHSAKHKLVIA